MHDSNEEKYLGDYITLNDEHATTIPQNRAMVLNNTGNNTNHESYKRIQRKDKNWTTSLKIPHTGDKQSLGRCG